MTILTFIAPIDTTKRAALDAALADLARQANTPGNPFAGVRTLHFASFVVFDEGPDEPLLVFENNFDGALDDHLRALVAALGGVLRIVFGCCAGYDEASASSDAGLSGYLRSRIVKPAAYHIGNVGRSRDRILAEADLQQEVASRVDARMLREGAPISRDAAYGLVRQQMIDAGRFQWVTDPHERETFAERVTPRVRLIGVIALAVLLLPVILIAAIPAVVILRFKESRDRSMDPADLDSSHVQRLTEAEDHRIQNHLASITPIKDGLFRRATIAVVLWLVNLVARTSTHGSLSGIASIHFAHWALLDGGRRLLFLSNFDGSWENYLDDFIDKAAPGLTMIWTNAVGFPPARFLRWGGATDGAAFKAYARNMQVKTAVWYSAYPHVTVQQIDAHSTLREGLAAKPTGAALDAWLRSV